MALSGYLQRLRPNRREMCNSGTAHCASKQNWVTDAGFVIGFAVAQAGFGPDSCLISATLDFLSASWHCAKRNAFERLRSPGVPCFGARRVSRGRVKRGRRCVHGAAALGRLLDGCVAPALQPPLTPGPPASARSPFACAIFWAWSPLVDFWTVLQVLTLVFTSKSHFWALFARHFRIR